MLDFAAAPAWSSLLLALFVYPLLEELVFRYGLLAWLDGTLAVTKKAPLLRWVSNALVSTVFSLTHAAFNPTTEGVTHAFLVFFPSLFLGWLWQHYEKLWLCVAVHAGMNGMYWWVGRNVFSALAT